jgi:UDP-glucose 4-epimerase
LINVLITGLNSYIGNNLEKWLNKEPKLFKIEKIDLKNSNWKEFDFSNFDVVFHAAAIVHQNIKENQKEVYHRVNEDLAIEVAKKSSISGVKQFIFLSTMGVYGINEGSIDKESKVKPINLYGLSKRNAELGIQKLEKIDFNVVILRLPLVYGPKSVGNYSLLSSFVKKYKIFPKIHNKKSFIFIDHLNEFVRLIILNKSNGIFHPQNSFYISTLSLVEEIKSITDNKIIISKIFNFIKIFKRMNKVSKVLNSLYYDESLYSEEEKKMIIQSSMYSFSETIELTETSK